MDISHKYYSSEIPRLDPKIRKHWTTWLRSEEFKGKEGVEALQTIEGNFCCLGVYCEKIHVPYQIGGGGQPFYGLSGTESKGYIPPGFEIPWLDKEMGSHYKHGYNGSDIVFSTKEQGGPQDVGRVHHNRLHTLPTLNDSKQFTFAQLADIIDYFL